MKRAAPFDDTHLLHVQWAVGVGYLQQAAHLFEALGLEDWKETALRESSELGGKSASKESP